MNENKCWEAVQRLLGNYRKTQLAEQLIPKVIADKLVRWRLFHVFTFIPQIVLKTFLTALKNVITINACTGPRILYFPSDRSRQHTQHGHCHLDINF